MRIYLVQRGKIKQRKKDKMVKDCVEWDYMGASEFEWGALPKSMRRIQKDSNQYKRYRSSLLNMFKDPLVLYHKLDDSELEQYIKMIEGLSEGKEDRLHEPSYLKYWFEEKEGRFGSLYYQDQCDLWWDIENDVFLSFDNKFMKTLPHMLENSWRYMDEQAKLERK